MGSHRLPAPRCSPPRPVGCGGGHTRLSVQGLGDVCDCGARGRDGRVVAGAVELQVAVKESKLDVCLPTRIGHQDDRWGVQQVT